MKEREHAKEEYVRRVISDSITDALEDALIRGRLKRRDIQYWYEKIGRTCCLPDLIPSTEEERVWLELQRINTLKEAIKERLRCDYYSPVPIPEPAKEKPKPIWRRLFGTLASKLQPSTTGALDVVPPKHLAHPSNGQEGTSGPACGPA